MLIYHKFYQVLQIEISFLASSSEIPMEPNREFGRLYYDYDCLDLDRSKVCDGFGELAFRQADSIKRGVFYVAI